MAVTNFDDANVAVFRMVSAGAAYNITLPFAADTIEWWNYTKYGTANVDATVGKQGIWVRGFPSGDALEMDTIVDNGVTGLTNLVLTTSNGITQLPDGSGFADNHRTPTAITASALGGVVTSANHGLTNGQFVRATDFRAFPVADATGMYGLNNQMFQIGNVTTNTFQLFYPYTNVGVDTSAEVAFVNNGVAQFTLIGESLYTENPAPTFSYTLGTTVMGATSDVIYVRATKANQYTDLGVLV